MGPKTPKSTVLTPADAADRIVANAGAGLFAAGF
jgi:hypothetical protein